MARRSQRRCSDPEPQKGIVMEVKIRPYIEYTTGDDAISFPKRDLSKEPPFGKWIVLSFAGRDASYAAHWNCCCECGTDRVVRQAALLSGRSLCCGCDGRASLRERATVHGSSRMAEHGVWRHMLKRCQYEGDAAFHRYGGRGITVCERWQKFENFLADMGLRPSPKHSIERIKNWLGYSPDNCKWATSKEQANNRRSNKQLEYKGVTKNIAEWAEYADMPVTTLWVRLRAGWSTEDAIGKPVRKYTHISHPLANPHHNKQETEHGKAT